MVMAVPDMKKLLELKQIAMKRCEERILEAARRPPCKKRLEDDDRHGMTRKMTSKYGL